VGSGKNAAMTELSLEGPFHEVEGVPMYVFNLPNVPLELGKDHVLGFREF
jgi:hypothetical protein